MPKPGERVSYRPMPKDFVDVYVRLGINGAKAHFRAHFRSVDRWIEQCGGDELRRQRCAYLVANGRAKSVIKVWHRKRLAKVHAERYGDLRD